MVSIKSFFENLRTLDDSSRRTWVFILSGVTMLFVLILWISYLNVTIVGVPSALIDEERVAAVSEESNMLQTNSPIANFKHNASLIYENLKVRILGLTNKGNEIIIVK